MNRKLALIGDTHGSAPAVKRGIDLALENGGVLLSLGDFGIWPGRRGAQFMKEVSNSAVELGVDVYVTPGNHDDYDQIDALEYNELGVAEISPNIYVFDRGAIVELNGVGVASFGGATSIDGPNGIWPTARWVNHGWWAREDIDEIDVRQANEYVDNAQVPVDIMVSHDAPAGAVFVNDRYPPYPMSMPNKQKLEEYRRKVQPKACFWGHYHDAMMGHVGGSTYGYMLNAADLTTRFSTATLVKTREGDPVDKHRDPAKDALLVHAMNITKEL